MPVESPKSTATTISSQEATSSSRNQKTSSTALRAVPMSLFPTCNSLQDALDQAIAATPVVSKNEMRTLLMTYHNTLLQEIQNQGKQLKLFPEID